MIQFPIVFLSILFCRFYGPAKLDINEWIMHPYFPKQCTAIFRNSVSLFSEIKHYDANSLCILIFRNRCTVIFRLQMGSVNTIVGDVGSDLGNNAPSYVASRSGAVVNASSFELGQDIKPDFSAGINNLSIKTLFIYSSYNKAYPDSWAEKISSAYPNKEIFKAQGVGHSGMLDQVDFWTTTMEPKIISYIQSL